MLQPALTPAQCYISQCQISCIEVSDLRFNSYLYCISMIFAFLRLPVCPCSPSTTTQSLLHRVAAQREPWESPTDFSAAWAWATHLHTVGRSTLPAPCPGQHTWSRSAHLVPVSTPSPGQHTRSRSAHTKAEQSSGCQPLPSARCSRPWSWWDRKSVV